MLLKRSLLIGYLILLGTNLRAQSENAPTTPPLQSDAERIKQGETFLAGLFDPELNLLPEFRGSKTYWLYHDNYLAAHLLGDAQPDLSRRIRAALVRFGATNSGKIEIVFGEAADPLPFRHYLLTNVAAAGDKIIKTEVVTPALMRGWEEYADLLLLAAIAEAPKSPDKAKRHFQEASALWDGQGLKDRAVKHMGIYSTYKLALYQIAAARLKIDPPHREKALQQLRAMQQGGGGYITDYKDGKRIGLANVETTCLALLALKSQTRSE